MQGGTTRHFFVEEGASLSAINVAFKNGKSDYGGAIASLGTIARLDNVVFEGNTATQRGGAVALGGSGSSLGNVTGCTFRGNRALEGVREYTWKITSHVHVNHHHDVRR